MAEPPLSMLLDKGRIREDSVVCRFYASGYCFKGDKCCLPHENDGLRIPDTVCRYYLKRNCSFGKKCAYDHVYFFERDGIKFIQRSQSQYEARRYQREKKMHIGDTSACASVKNQERENDRQDENSGLGTQHLRTSTTVRGPSTIPSFHLSDDNVNFENLKKKSEKIGTDCYTRDMNRGSNFLLRSASCPDISGRLHQALDIPANSETDNLSSLEGFPERNHQTRCVLRSDENSEVHDKMFPSLNETINGVITCECGPLKEIYMEDGQNLKDCLFVINSDISLSEVRGIFRRIFGS